MTILIFFLVLFVLILVHEWGHFIVAKKTGMRVDEFGIGFPPKLFGVKKGETEYTFNALPIGGFVKILGENMSDADETVAGSFSSKSKWAQAAVLVAGVTMNIIFAWVLILAAFMIGVPTSVDESTASADATLTIAAVLPESPAAQAGVPVGAEIVSVSAGGDVIQTLTPSSFRQFTQDHSTEVLELTYFDGSSNVTLEITPEVGLLEEETQLASTDLALTLIETVSEPIHKAAYDATVTTGRSLVAITVGIFTLLIDSFQGDADFSQVAGPVGIVSLVGDAAQFGITSLMMFTAIISLNLAVINMFPFPALDGGRLLFVAIEAIRRKPINPIWVARLNTVGFILLMVLMVAVTYSDIVKKFFSIVIPGKCGRMVVLGEIRNFLCV